MKVTDFSQIHQRTKITRKLWPQNPERWVKADSYPSTEMSEVINWREHFSDNFDKLVECLREVPTPLPPTTPLGSHTAELRKVTLWLWQVKEESNPCEIPQPLFHK